MEQRRVAGVLEALAAAPPGPLVDRWCAVATDRLDAAGAGVALVLDEGVLEPVHATGLALATDTLHADLGEGPAFEAHRNGEPVLIDDLATTNRWLAFTPAATRAGIGAVFAFPLRSGVVRLGAATFCRPLRGELTADQHADALILARFALDLVLAVQAGRDGDDLDQLFVAGAGSTAEIHQATGIAAVQLRLPVDGALAVLRARAYADRRPLRDVARDVVARDLRLDDGR